MRVSPFEMFNRCSSLGGRPCIEYIPQNRNLFIVDFIKDSIGIFILGCVSIFGFPIMTLYFIYRMGYKRTITLYRRFDREEKRMRLK